MFDLAVLVKVNDVAAAEERLAALGGVAPEDPYAILAKLYPAGPGKAFARRVALLASRLDSSIPYTDRLAAARRRLLAASAASAA